MVEKKKKKIREKFTEIFQTGDEQKIKKILDKNPWLLNEVSNKMNVVMEDQEQVLAALGIMEDELGGAVTINEIIFSLKMDFNIKKSEAQVQDILSNSENLDLIKALSNGWILTDKGGNVCDDYLNKNIKKN